jgi:uncharacterized protein (DUF362 family)
MKTLAFLYVFLFVCLFKMHATQPTAKQQQPPKDCVKHPQIVKAQTVEKATSPKVIAEKPANTATQHTSRSGNSVPHFSVLNFINFFYSKDTLDNLRVM